MATKLNFAGVEDQKSFRPAPAGVYTLELTDYKEDTVKNGDNKGATLLKFTYEIRSEDEALDGKKVWDNATVTKKAMFRIKAMIKAFGVEVDDSENADDVEVEWDDFLGESLVARLSLVPATKDPNTGREYAAKNSIAKFIIDGEEDDE